MFNKKSLIVLPLALSLALCSCAKPDNGGDVNASIISYLEERNQADMASVMAAINEANTPVKEPTSVEPTLPIETEPVETEPAPTEPVPTEPDITPEINSEEEVTIDPVESSIIASSIEESIAESIRQSIAESIYEVEKESVLAKETYWASVATSFIEWYFSGLPSNESMVPGEIHNINVDSIPLIRQLFSDVVIVGNSRAESIVSTGVLTDNEVVYAWASHCDSMIPQFEYAAALYRSKLLVIMGVNDMGYYMWEEERFRNDYVAMIEAYKAINPNSQIYLMEILPINPDYYYRWYNHFRMDRYNEIIREIAATYGYTVVTASAFAVPAYNLPDGSGAHYNLQFQLYWAQCMANQMNLWGN